MTQQDPEERQTSQAETEVAEVGDIESLKKALDEQKAKAEANLAGWQRAQADFINYKRRSEQEREDINKFANAILMLSLLPILDDFERAYTSLPPELAEVTWVDGVKLVERKLRATLETQGLSEIKALGEPFDPNLHEAAGQTKGKEGIVTQELQKGYKFRDRVIRPSKVMVGSEEKEEKKEE